MAVILKKDWSSIETTSYKNEGVKYPNDTHEGILGIDPKKLAGTGHEDLTVVIRISPAGKEGKTIFLWNFSNNWGETVGRAGTLQAALDAVDENLQHQIKGAVLNEKNNKDEFYSKFIKAGLL